MIYSNFTGNDYSISSDNTSNQCYYTTTSSSYPDYAQMAAHIGEYITYLRRNNDLISTDDLVVKQDLADEEFLWKQLFTAVCQNNPDKMPDYMTVFKIMNENYKETVIAIELAKKKEV